MQHQRWYLDQHGRSNPPRNTGTLAQGAKSGLVDATSFVEEHEHKEDERQNTPAPPKAMLKELAPSQYLLMARGLSSIKARCSPSLAKITLSLF